MEDLNTCCCEGREFGCYTSPKASTSTAEGVVRSWLTTWPS